MINNATLERERKIVSPRKSAPIHRLTHQVGKGPLKLSEQMVYLALDIMMALQEKPSPSLRAGSGSGPPSPA